MGRMEGRTVLVTGAARGIGAAVVKLLSAEGAAVIATDVLDEPGKELVDTLSEMTIYAHLDVTREQDWRVLVERIQRSWAPITDLVNNAGIVEFADIDEQSPESFRRVLEINLVGAWLGMHTLAPTLRRASGGAVVNMSSSAGVMGYAGVGAYVASKWGLRGLTKTAALELAPDGVRVCSLHPGPVRTPMTEAFDDSVVAGQPLARFGHPEEVATMVLFLLADATYSTGAEFVLDGGATVGATLDLPDHR